MTNLNLPIIFNAIRTTGYVDPEAEKIKAFWLNMPLRSLTAKQIAQSHHDKSQLKGSRKFPDQLSDADKKTKPEKQKKYDPSKHEPKPIVKEHVVEDPQKTGNDVPTIANENNARALGDDEQNISPENKKTNR